LSAKAGNLTLIQTNSNLIIDGHSPQGTSLVAVAGGTHIALVGSWTNTGDDKPNLLLRNVGFSNGARGLDTTSVTGFNEGLLKLDNCLFDNLTDYAVVMLSSVYYGRIFDCQFNLCKGSLKVYDNTETILGSNVHKPRGPSVTVGSITNGSRTLTITGTALSMMNVDDLVLIPGAGAGGGEFLATIKSVSGATVTLYEPAGTTVVGAAVYVAAPSIWTKAANHLKFTGEQLYEGNGGSFAPDIRFVAGSVDASSSVADIIGCKFGAERDEGFDHGRYKIEVYQPPDVSNPTITQNNVGPVHLFACEFDHEPGLPITALSRDNSNNASVTVSCSSTWGARLKAGDRIQIVDAPDRTFCGIWTVISPGTAGVSQTITFKCNGSATTVVNPSGFLFSLSISSIGVRSPIAGWSVDRCVFNGVPNCVDDIFTGTDNFRNGSGGNIWGDNDVHGPNGYGARELKNGSNLFQRFNPSDCSPHPRVRVEARSIESFGIQQRITHTSDSSHWGQLGITATPGQTGSRGKTTAVLLTRGNTQPGCISGDSPSYTLQEAVSVPFDATGLGQYPVLYFDAKRFANSTGNTDCEQISAIVVDGASGNVHWRSFTLPASGWKRFAFPLRLNAGGSYGAIVFIPGPQNAQPGAACYIDNPQLSDWECDFLPNETGSLLLDTSAGTRFSQDIRIDPSAQLRGDLSTDFVKLAHAYVLGALQLNLVTFPMADGVNTPGHSTYDNGIIVLTGTLTANRQFLLPANGGFRVWLIKNECNNSVSLLDTNGNSGPNVASGHYAVVFPRDTTHLGGFTV